MGLHELKFAETLGGATIFFWWGENEKKWGTKLEEKKAWGGDEEKRNDRKVIDDYGRRGRKDLKTCLPVWYCPHPTLSKVCGSAGAPMTIYDMHHKKRPALKAGMS